METNNTHLIDRCCRKDSKAQMELYGRYAKRLYMTCFRIIGSTVDAEEAMQDAFLKIFMRIDQYDRTKNFEVWMQRIAVNTAIDYVRKQTPLTEELFENKIELEEETVEDEEDLSLSVEKIKNGIQQLAPGYRLILSLYLFEGYDMEEIAQILKVRPSTVRSQYMRGKNKLVELMKE